MKFVHGDTTEASLIISEAVNKSIEKGPTLLLVSGGSNIELAVSVRQNLKIKHELTVGLIDERYGPVGHKDSNWQKLVESGFDTSGVNLLRALKGLDFEETAAEYDKNFERALEGSKTVIGIFGMGSDGHTAGILPFSPAANSQKLVACYNAADYQRITLTPAAIKFFDTVFLVALGESKRIQLQNLVNKKLPLSQQPAQALKKAKKLTVISDQPLDSVKPVDTEKT